MTSQGTADWIAVDWGTSQLRAWAMQGRRTMAQASSDEGMSRLAKEEFEPALLSMVGKWIGDRPVEVIACGMVGARQGWAEMPYISVPATPLPKAPIAVSGTDPRINVYIVPGLKQERPADVMRGEETQIAGFLALHDNWDGVICLPGTHTKWVRVSANEVVSFQTFMTGEMFDLLSGSSVLRHSVGTGWDANAFDEALGDALSRPEAFAARLFGIRAQDLLEGQEASVARARLSGLLIGIEMAAARLYWLGQQIAVIGADTLSTVYADAIAKQGAPVVVQDAGKMTLAGLSAARKQLETAG